MEHYVGLDVSLKLTAICIVDRTGKIEREGVVASDPETIAAFVKSHAPHVVRVGLEAGATSTWLWTELSKLGPRFLGSNHIRRPRRACRTTCG
jgi:transposase